MPNINVSDEFKKLVDVVQEKRGLKTAGEAADAIGHTYVGRVNAVKRWADKNKPAPKAKKAKAPAKKAKAPAKKASKAEA
jgi:hypothetical protein